MGRIFIGFICIFSWVSAKADAGAPFSLNPYYPEFSSTDSEETFRLEQSLQREMVRFAEQRERVQKVWVEHMPYDPELMPKDTFILRRLMDRSTSRFMKSSYFRSTGLGEMAATIKEKTETDLQFKDEKNQNHRFDFKLALFQGQAFIQYEGATKAQLRYDVRDGGQLAMIFQHSLSANSQIGIENAFTGENRYQLMTLNLTW